MNASGLQFYCARFWNSNMASMRAGAVIDRWLSVVSAMQAYPNGGWEGSTLA